MESGDGDECVDDEEFETCLVLEEVHEQPLHAPRKSRSYDAYERYKAIAHRTASEHAVDKEPEDGTVGV